MIRILSTDGLASQIRDIISQAKDKVILISPFLDEKSDIFDYLDDLRKKSYDVPIFVITRCPEQSHFSKQSHKNAIKRFSSIRKCFVHYCPDLHTKCYFNEYDMVITSLNMLPSSEENNFELGVHINKYDLDGKPYSDALLEINKICEAAVPKMNQIASDGTFSQQKMKAFCIASREEITFKGIPDSDTVKNYIEYRVYKNLDPTEQERDYPQKYCHLCGRSFEEDKKNNKRVFKSAPTLEQPFCEQCNSYLSAVNLDNFQF